MCDCEHLIRLDAIDHGVPHGLLGLRLGTYAMETPGVQFGSKVSVFFDEGETCLQPNGVLQRVSAQLGPMPSSTPSGTATRSERALLIS